MACLVAYADSQDAPDAEGQHVSHYLALSIAMRSILS